MKKDDQLLDRFEESINKLKLEYDIFFNGGADQFPQKHHEELNLEVKLIKSSGGVFEVTADERLIFSKKKEHRFPENQEIVEGLKKF